MRIVSRTGPIALMFSALVVVVCGSAGNLHAQSHEQSLFGNVTDQLGGVLVGAGVTIATNIVSNASLDTTADAQGRFLLSVELGTYLSPD